MPHRFSWVEKPYLAAMARPADNVELNWLRDQGIQVVITLTENPLRRDWVNDVGLMAVHIPIPDLAAPTTEQFEHCVQTIRRARDNRFGVAVHCAAGIGRTGTIIAGWFVAEGMKSSDALRKVRMTRPGSVETPEQERALEAYGRWLRAKAKPSGDVESQPSDQ
ncbi:MAG: dual specificity protein phosphatase family protein [Gemmataceae bacterium]|nr:dual specificity protein phosphatase family protein [Gemmataceae bacterium]